MWKNLAGNLSRKSGCYFCSSESDRDNNIIGGGGQLWPSVTTGRPHQSATNLSRHIIIQSAPADTEDEETHGLPAHRPLQSTHLQWPTEAAQHQGRRHRLRWRHQECPSGFCSGLCHHLRCHRVVDCNHGDLVPQHQEMQEFHSK